MYRVCSAAEMRRADAGAAELIGIPGIVLMENAAAACVKKLAEKFELSRVKAAVFCGKGNNGGDGFAAARRLRDAGAEVVIYLVCGRSFSGDALTNFEIAEKTGCEIVDIYDDSLYSISEYDIVIDAIFGTGITGEVRGAACDVIDEINKNARYVLSVDVPSGLNSDTGEICGRCIKADDTVTFAAYKKGMFCFPGAEYCGRITVGDISMPRTMLEDCRMCVTDREFVKNAVPPRAANSHKGDYGKVFAVAGSVGMTGAAALCTEAALKSGAGLITLGIAEGLNAIMEQKLTEVMTLPLPQKYGHLSDEAAERITEQMKKSSVILFGPGLGRSRDIIKLLSAVLSSSEIPVVIDADGLYALAQDPDMLSDCSCDVVLTPHSAELARLMGCTAEEIEKDRMGMCAQAAERFGATIILKGHYTVVTAADGMQYINTTGNCGMATGGSGDVLAGITAALIGRGAPEGAAAAAAVYLHGLAGDFAAEKVGEDALTPSDILENISCAFRTVSN